MTLTVETGTGLPDADAFIDLAFANAYHTAAGSSGWAGEDADKEAAIRRATSHLSDAYRWEGVRTRGRSQALAWPRSGVSDAEGYGIASNTIPIELKRATAELALRELVSPGSMNPDFVASEAVKREKIGPIEVEYLNASVSADAKRPVVLIVRDMIGQFLCSERSGILAGTSYRT